MKSAKRQRQFVSYDQAREIAILCSLHDKEERDVILHIKDELEADGKRVRMLCLANKKSDPEALENLSDDQICYQKEFAWTMRPKTDHLKGFVNNRFDVLLDLSPAKAFPLKYLAVLSPSSYKIGPYHPDFLAIYDLFINAGEECPATELARHAVHYLKLIKTPDNHDT
ncbi:MAG: hypothetical protein R6U62_08165 [Bacteroidales bacterium]